MRGTGESVLSRRCVCSGKSYFSAEMAGGVPFEKDSLLKTRDPEEEERKEGGEGRQAGGKI